MDTFEDKDLGQQTPHDPDPAPAVQEAPAQNVPEPPVYGPTSEQSTYRNAGVGRRESPFANSPYVMNHQNGSVQQNYYNQSYPNRYTSQPYGYQPPQQPVRAVPPVQPQRDPEPVREKHTGKKHGHSVFKTIVAAVLVLALVAGGCLVTASVVDSRWQAQNQQMQDSFDRQIASLQQQIQSIENAAGANSPASTGDSVSGSPVASGDSLTPSQVYARNVDAVVMITSYVNSQGTFTSGTAVSTGSGFFISEDGYTLTNHHVIDGATSVAVTTRDGNVYVASIVGSDSTNDVALLKVEAQGLPYAAIGSSADLIVGDQVAAIGNPLGELTSTMTVGYVSGKERDVTTDGTTINMIQTDAAINSGNSGGPLFNMKGEVVGITTAKYSGSSSSGASIEGIGFAIPMDDVMVVVSDLMEFGYVRSAYMGIMVRDMGAEMAEIYGLPVGAYVDSVEKSGPAADAGMKAKDIIIGLGEYTIQSRTDLTKALRSFEPGDTTTVYIYRAGAELELQITLAERPQDADSSTQTQPDSEMPNEGSYEDWYDYFFPRG